MRSASNVKIKIPAQSFSCLRHRFISMHVHFLILHASPQAFHKHVVPPTALAVHADGNAIAAQCLGECVTGELAAVIGIEYLRPTYNVSASSNASRQKSVVIVMETRHESTRRVAQSKTAARYTNPRAIEISVISIAHT